jgi:hypothetical protein
LPGNGSQQWSLLLTSLPSFDHLTSSSWRWLIPSSWLTFHCNSPAIRSLPRLSFRVKAMLRWTTSRPVCLGLKPRRVLKTRFLLLSGSCRFVDVEHPLWREDGSVVYNCCWPLPAQSFSGPNPAGLMTIFSVSDSRLPQPGGPGPWIYIPQEQGGLVIPAGTGFRGVLLGSFLANSLGAHHIENTSLNNS